LALAQSRLANSSRSLANDWQRESNPESYESTLTTGHLPQARRCE